MKLFLVLIFLSVLSFIYCGSSGQKTDSGITYEIVTEGTGSVPVKGQVVSVHYTGTLQDNTKFDSSRDRNMPFNFIVGVGNVIEGWDEIVQMMKTGSTWNVSIPSELAYKDRQQEPIPPNSDLNFEIELLDIIDEEVTTGSGIRYVVLQPGGGATPETGQTAIVHYNVWLSDWRKLDSSFMKGQPYPVEIGAGKVIKGWDIIPWQLAYGENGREGVPPKSDLTFEMMLLGVQ